MYQVVTLAPNKFGVIFSMRDYRKGGLKTTLTLTTKEFIRRFQLHVLPKGFTRIRHYGILGSSWKKEKLPQLQIKLADKDRDVLIVYTAEEKTMGRRCPSCKKGALVTLLNFDNRGPPKEYEEIAQRKILKYSA